MVLPILCVKRGLDVLVEMWGASQEGCFAPFFKHVRDLYIYILGGGAHFSACGILVSPPEIKPTTPIVEAQSLNH